MKTRWQLGQAAVCLLLGACAASPVADLPENRAPSPVPVRTSHAPDWVKKVPDRMATVLVERHLCKDGPAWGAARRDPTGKLYDGLEFEEFGSAAFCNLVKEYNLWNKVPPLTDQEKKRSMQYWQSWQDPKTGVFQDPRDPKRLVGEKYVVSLIRFFGGEPLLVDGADVFLWIHKALVDDNLAAPRMHVSRAVRVALEHGAKGGVAGLTDAGFRNADDAHDGVLLFIRI